MPDVDTNNKYTQVHSRADTCSRWKHCRLQAFSLEHNRYFRGQPDLNAAGLAFPGGDRINLPGSARTVCAVKSNLAKMPDRTAWD